MAGVGLERKRLGTAPPAALKSESIYQDRGPDKQDRSPQQSSHISLLRPLVGNTIPRGNGAQSQLKALLRLE
jgi:hypothetical protein